MYLLQCAKGHVVCSLCSESLKDVVNCHVCRVAMPGGYQRCHAMERVVDSIRMPCPHAPYGCDMRTAYHAQEEHLLECPHAPCGCPDDACGFVGTVATLVTHLKAAHGWPCTAEVSAGESFLVDLLVGFNFLTAVRGSAQYLLLLNMACTPFGHAISAVWISSLTATMNINSSAPATSRNMTCELELCFMQFKHVQLQRGYYEKSRFQVECICPSNGLPDPNDSFQFFVPKCVGGNEALVHVTAVIFI
jgi:E3 ubiquitin-protein ligase SIAH1